MSPAMAIASIALIVASFCLVCLAARWWTDRADGARLAEIESELERQGRVLAAVTSPVPAADRGPNAVFIPARRPDPPEPARPPKPVLIAVPDLAPATTGSVEPPAEMVRRFGAIWDLADSGATAERIARDTGHPIGQVELILGLRRTRGVETRGECRE